MNYKLNVESDGDCIAILKSDKKLGAKKYQPLICIGEGARNGFEELKLNKGEHFEITPNINKERDVFICCRCIRKWKIVFRFSICKEF